MNEIFSLAIFLKTESTDSYLFAFEVTEDQHDTGVVLTRLRDSLDTELAHVMEVMVESTRSMKSRDGAYYEVMIKEHIFDLIEEYSQED